MEELLLKFVGNIDADEIQVLEKLALSPEFYRPE